MRPTVVLTQPAARAVVLSEALGGHGIGTLSWPMTAIDEVPGLDWPAIAATFSGCRWVLFPSPASIDVTMAGLRRHGLRWPAGVGIGLIGPGSRDTLDAWRGRIDGLAAAPTIEPPTAPHDAEALLSREELASLRGVGIAVPRRADGREAWLRVLRARGATLQDLTVYSAGEVDPPEGAADWLEGRRSAGAGVAFSIASASAGARLAGFAATLACRDWALACPALTQHPRIAEALLEQGWRRVLRHRPGAEGLIAAIESLSHA